MIKLSKFIPILLIATTLSSCGVFNKVFKSSNKYKEQSESTTHKEEKVVSSDSSVTTIKEKADSTIYTKPKKDKSSIPVKNLSDIKNLTLINNDFVNIRQTYDSLRGSLKTEVEVKSQGINFKLDKETTIKNNIKTTKDSKQDSTGKKAIVAKNSVKQKEPVNILWYILSATGVLGVFYYISKKYFKRAI